MKEVKKIIKKEFILEFLKARKECPLLIAALYTKNRKFVSSISINDIGNELANISLDPKVYPTISQKYNILIRNFELALARAQTDADVRQAFEDFCDGWTNAPIGGGYRECTNCNGTGEVAGEPCSYCGGDGNRARRSFSLTFFFA